MKIGTIALLAIGIIIVNPTLQMPAVTQYVGGGGPIFADAAVPVRVHHDRLRRDLRLPWPDRIRHDAEDGRQGKRHPADRLRRDALRRARRHHGAHRRDGASPERLLRDQRHAGRLPDAQGHHRRADAAGPPSRPGTGRRRERRRPDGRRRVAGHRHGRHLQPVCPACAA